jgi:AraC-like DNA-binding protein
MSGRNSIGIDAATFRRLNNLYRRRWGISLQACRADGSIVLDTGSRAGKSSDGDAVRRLAIDEALRWGEVEVESSPTGLLVWAVPLMHNAQVVGGLVAAISERRLFPENTAKPIIDTRAACCDLRRLAEEYNLTNAALLEARRNQSIRERQRAEAIHAYKVTESFDLHSLYLLDEPMLVAAIRKGDRGQARAILNRLLVAMIQRSEGRLDLVKSFFMELVVTLCRTAVEAGGAAEELLGANFDGISHLSRIESDEQLAPWLHDMLERIMDSIQRNRKQSHPAMVSLALQFMAEHCCEDISRDDAAKAAYLSPSHFSRFFKKYLGQNFTVVLNQMRVERAAELLANTDKDLKRIAQETGFADQSYFTKVFRKLRRMTPAEYRKQQRPRREA